jgi:hypothetical protein
MGHFVATGKESIVRPNPDRPRPTPSPSAPRPIDTASLRRGMSSASLRKIISEAGERLPGLRDEVGRLLADNNRERAQLVQQQVDELDRQIRESEMALPIVEAREAEYRSRQTRVPVLLAEARLIVAGRARRMAEIKRRQAEVTRAVEALRQYTRETEGRLRKLTSELNDLGNPVGLLSDIELARSAEALDALADRWEREANPVLSAGLDPTTPPMGGPQVAQRSRQPVAPAGPFPAPEEETNHVNAD